MSLVVVKDKQLCPVPIRGVFTLPTEDALVRCVCPDKCEGILLPQIPLEARMFQIYAYQLQDRLIERQRARGRELTGDVRLHGPFPSYDLNHNLTDVKASLWAEAARRDANGDEHPELLLDAVFERDQAFSPYSDYVYLATFLGYEYVTRQSDEGGLPLL
jgi:hypothetical protein